MNKPTTNYDLTTLKVDILDKSEKGIKIRAFNKSSSEWQVHWLPKSQTTIGEGEIKIPYWLALKNDLV